MTNVYDEYPLFLIPYSLFFIARFGSIILYRSLGEHYFFSGACDYYLFLLNFSFMSLHSLLSEYAESHQNRVNKLIHYVCVPLIYFSIVGMLYSVELGTWNGVEVRLVYLIMFLVLVYYARLSWGLFGVMSAFSGLCIWGNYQVEQHVFIPLYAVDLTVFVLAWIGQFIGHHIEGKKPSFFKDLQFLLIGPAWILWRR